MEPVVQLEGSPDKENTHALELGAFGHRLMEGVLCVLDPEKEWAPAVLVGMAVCPQEASYFLDLPLCLHFGLWVITSKECHVQTSHKHSR